MKQIDQIIPITYKDIKYKQRSNELPKIMLRYRKSMSAMCQRKKNNNLQWRTIK